MVNFRNIMNENQLEKKINPIEVYETLDRKSIAGPLRVAQEYILKKWFES